MHYWHKLKYVINPVDNMYTFTRDKSVLEKYLTHKESIVNLYDYLMKLLFKNGEKIVIKENDYPYKLPNKIKHFLIWIHPNKNYTHSTVENFLKNFIEENKDLNIKDYILFRNNIVNKSIETIEHYHILFKIN
jgi:hypothetical protein